MEIYCKIKAKKSICKRCYSTSLQDTDVILKCEECALSSYIIYEFLGFYKRFGKFYAAISFPKGRIRFINPSRIKILKYELYKYTGKAIIQPPKEKFSECMDNTSEQYGVYQFYENFKYVSLISKSGDIRIIKTNKVRFIVGGISIKFDNVIGSECKFKKDASICEYCPDLLDKNNTNCKSCKDKKFMIVGYITPSSKPILVRDLYPDDGKMYEADPDNIIF